MARPLLIVLSAGMLAAGCARAQEGPTQLRKRHVLFIEAKAGQEIVLDIAAIRASLGYPDALAYRMFAPTGKSGAQGRLEPGETETLKLAPETDGLYVFEGNPGMNAFSVAVRGAAWAVSISDTRQLNVIGHARPLFFYVPTDLRELTLVFNGEAASMRLYRADGSQAHEQQLPQYETVTVTVPVEGGQAGWWRLELGLSEDQGIKFPEEVPPYIAEAPLSEELMRALLEGTHLVDFDLRPTPRTQLIAPLAGAVTHRAATADRLELGFTDTGRLISVKAGDTELAGGENAPLLGFFVRDVAQDSDLIAVEGQMVQTPNGLKTTGSLGAANLELQAAYASTAFCVHVTASVRNLAEEDRAITVYFALPFPRGDPVWWDDIIDARPATDNATYGAFDRMAAGANGHHSVYPFGCLAGDQGLALAIPMDYPIYHRIAACPGSRQLFLAVDLGLSEATAKFPNRAEFGFLIYRCDPRWGLRSAAERYYRIFPKFFAKRMTEDGGWVCWGDCEGMANLEELGLKYHWGPGGPAAVAFDDANDLYSFLYSDSARYFSDLGQFDHRPAREEAVAAMRRLLDAEDPRAHILSVRDSATGRRRYEGREAAMGREAAEQWLRDSIAAVNRSAALDANGEIQVGYLVNRQDWGGEDWWSGRCFCNIDPDIPGGYGQFLFEQILEPTVAQFRGQNAELDGFGLDNFFSNAHTVDFSRDHLAHCDYPPTFATGDFRPVIVGDTMMYEWVAELKRRLEAEGKWLMANTGRQPFCFAQQLLDMNGLEWGMEGTGLATRTLAYHKQVVTLPVRPEHYEERFIKTHLAMGAFPGGYAQGAQFQPGTETASLYAKYVPIIKRMNSAGWEPVPWATSDIAEVSIERFGSGMPLLFSLHNHTEEPCQPRITVELEPIGAVASGPIHDLVTGEEPPVELADGKMAFSVKLEASDVTVVEVRW